jgi:hypothetical protein
MVALKNKPQRVISNVVASTATLWHDTDNWKKILAAGVFVALLGSFGGFVNLLKPDEAVGLPPEHIDRRDFALLDPFDYSGLARAPQNMDEVRKFEKGLQAYANQLKEIEDQEGDKFTLLEASRMRGEAIAEAGTGTILENPDSLNYISIWECSNTLKRNYVCSLFRSMQDQAAAVARASAIMESETATSKERMAAFDLYSRAKPRLRASIYALYPPTYTALESTDVLSGYRKLIEGFYTLLKATPQISNEKPRLDNNPNTPFNTNHSVPQALEQR